MNAPTNPRVAAYYLSGAIATLLAALAFRSWGLFLLWPAISFLVAAIGYAGAGAAIYGKRRGRLPMGTRMLMAPMLLGQALSLRYYAGQCRAWDRVAPNLFIGKRLNEREAQTLLREGVTAVLDLTAEFSETRCLRRLTYLNLPILDLTAPTLEALHQGVAFLEEHAAKEGVYVHCKVGYSRTAAFAGAYLIASGQAKNAEEAMACLREVRPSMVIRPEIVRVLHQYECT